MNIEVNALPPSEKLDLEMPEEHPLASADTSDSNDDDKEKGDELEVPWDAMVEVLNKAMEDISYTNGGIAVGILNRCGSTLNLKRVLFWGSGVKQQLGMFGGYTPDVEIPDQQDTAYDLNFSLPIAPLVGITPFPGGVFNMIAYQGKDFDFLIGVRVWYATVTGTFGWWPYILSKLGRKDEFCRLSASDLYTVLKNQSRKQSIGSTSPPYRSLALCGKTGAHTFNLKVSVVKQQQES